MGKKILIVDDEPTSVLLVKRKLEDNGYTVFEAANGQIGLDATHNEDFDLIITDIMMPVMDGVDFFKALKASPHTANVPVVVITQSKTIKDSFRVLGVNDFFSKPLDPNVIFERVEALLNIPKSKLSNNKVFIVGNNQRVVKKMSNLLKMDGNDVVVGSDATESFSKILAFVPDIIFIDVLLRDFSAKELTRAVKTFLKLQNSRVILFNTLTQEDHGNGSVMDHLNREKDACLESGAQVYFGDFYEATFLNSFHEVISSS